jgi:hypothetical protein
MQSVDKKCPTLFEHLRFAGYRLDEPQEVDLDIQEIESDEEHLSAAAQVHVVPKGDAMQDDLLSVTRPSSLQPGHIFSTSLLDAYRKDYGMPTLQGIGKHRVSWARRLKFELP